MSQPYVGEIRIFAGNFAPAGWMFCEGQLLPISENQTLFSLIGTTYGGDGQATFALPDLRGRMPVHQGQGPGLSPYVIGQLAGTEAVALAANAIPAHNHAPGSGASSESASPAGNVGGPWSGRQYSDGPATGNPHAGAVQAAGTGQPHENMPPFLVIRFVIALEGVFPSRN